MYGKEWNTKHNTEWRYEYEDLKHCAQHIILMQLRLFKAARCQQVYQSRMEAMLHEAHLSPTGAWTIKALQQSPHLA